MRTRKLFATAATGALLVALAVAPASAANSGSTDATFTLTTAGTLDIVVPDSGTNGASDLGTTAVPAVATPFTSAAGAFGDVQVVDARASALGWTAQATGTDFIHSACPDDDGVTAGIQCSDANMYFDNATVTYTPGTPSINLGALSVTTPTPGFLGCTLELDCAKVVYVGTGSSDVTWQPTVTFPVTNTHVAGTYSGTISHSVA